MSKSHAAKFIAAMDAVAAAEAAGFIVNFPVRVRPREEPLDEAATEAHFDRICLAEAKRRRRRERNLRRALAFHRAAPDAHFEALLP